jgi:hypothetical protein
MAVFCSILMLNIWFSPFLSYLLPSSFFSLFKAKVRPDLVIRFPLLFLGNTFGHDDTEVHHISLSLLIFFFSFPSLCKLKSNNDFAFQLTQSKKDNSYNITLGKESFLPEEVFFPFPAVKSFALFPSSFQQFFFSATDCWHKVISQ